MWRQGRETEDNIKKHKIDRREGERKEQKLKKEMNLIFISSLRVILKHHFPKPQLHLKRCT
jgi:hypothetical protein